jgi:hypothetical protein
MNITTNLLCLCTGQYEGVWRPHRRWKMPNSVHQSSASDKGISRSIPAASLPCSTAEHARKALNVLHHSIGMVVQSHEDMELMRNSHSFIRACVGSRTETMSASPGYASYILRTDEYPRRLPSLQSFRGFGGDISHVPSLSSLVMPFMQPRYTRPFMTICVRLLKGSFLSRTGSAVCWFSSSMVQLVSP